MNKKALSMLSLTQKAGKLSSGELAVEKALQSGDACLIIIAEDASNNTKDKFNKKAFYYKVPVIICSNKAELSHAIGKDNRSALAICDVNFAKKIKEYIQDILTQ